MEQKYLDESEILEQIHNIRQEKEKQARWLFEYWVRAFGPEKARSMQHEAEHQIKLYDHMYDTSKHL